MPDKSGSHFPKLVTVHCYCQLFWKVHGVQFREIGGKAGLLWQFPLPTLATLLTACQPEYHRRDVHFLLSRKQREHLLNCPENIFRLKDGLDSPIANAFQKHALESMLVNNPLVHSCTTLPCCVRCVENCLDNVSIVVCINCFGIEMDTVVHWSHAVFATWKCHRTSLNTTTAN